MNGHVKRRLVFNTMLTLLVIGCSFWLVGFGWHAGLFLLSDDSLAKFACGAYLAAYTVALFVNLLAIGVLNSWKEWILGPIRIGSRVTVVCEGRAEGLVIGQSTTKDKWIVSYFSGAIYRRNSYHVSDLRVR